MKVVDKRTQTEKKTVGELPVGQAYLDRDGILCIKTRGEVEGYCSCLAYLDDKWEYDEEYGDTQVTPITTTLTIER